MLFVRLRRFTQTRFIVRASIRYKKYHFTFKLCYLLSHLDAIRILFAAWWIFIQVITSFYTAELTAVLTLSTNDLRVNNLNELKEDSGAKWVAVEGAQMELLKKNEHLSFLNEDLKTGKGQLVKDIPTALEKVINEDETLSGAIQAIAHR